MPSTPITKLQSLEAPGLLLRAFRDDDLEDLRTAFADEGIARWNPGPSDDEGIATFMSGRNDWSEGDHASWAVADSSDRLIGSVSVHKIDHDQTDAEIGYWVAPWARGQGVATRAVVAATGFAFDQIGLHRVYLFHSVDNHGSCGVARAAGFQLEGITRQSYRYADGRFHDEHLHGLLADDITG